MSSARGPPKSALLDADGRPRATRMMLPLWQGAQRVSEALGSSQLRIWGTVLCFTSSSQIPGAKQWRKQDTDPTPVTFSFASVNAESVGVEDACSSALGPWQSRRLPLALFRSLFGILFSVVPYRAGDLGSLYFPEGFIASTSFGLEECCTTELSTSALSNMVAVARCGY